MDLKEQKNNLDELFKQWEKEIEDKFVKDGIVNDINWQKANKKILVILKETNDFNKYGLNELINNNINNSKSGIWKGLTWHNTGRIAYALLNPNSNFKEADKNRKSALSYIAVMNLKKTAGKSASKKETIKKHTLKYADYIKKEINIINPDIVILGGTFDFIKSILNLRHISDNLYKEKNNDNRIYIKCYHPGYFRIKKEEYYNQCVKPYFEYIEKNSTS